MYKSCEKTAKGWKDDRAILQFPLFEKLVVIFPPLYRYRKIIYTRIIEFIIYICIYINSLFTQIKSQLSNPLQLKIVI